MADVYDVFLDTTKLAIQAGELVVSRGSSPLAIPSFQFTYTPEFLTAADSFALSPDMPLVREVYRSRTGDRQMLGAFADAMPDRWGRRLIERRLRQSHLPDIDYLLGVPDFTRQGALRISVDGGAGFVGSDYSYGGIRGLQDIYRAIQRFEAGTEAGSDLERILLTGSQSNGGQFPKTALIDDEGDLCIAKFQGDEQLASPHWEAACLAMAQAADIEVPAFEHRWLGNISVLIEKRFDRTPQGERIPYLSADSFMMLPSNPTFITPYTVFAGTLLRQLGPAEARKLFEHVAFLLLVNNTDDHWKNHGLLHTGGGWHLSPLFDVNPTTSPDPLDLPQLTMHAEVKRSLTSLVGDADSYGLSREAARSSIERIAAVVRDWRAYASRFVRSAQELEARSPAFTAQSQPLAELGI
jgi:serine/threonine-protein kinase HipA